MEQALAYAAAPCNGIRGPLARIRPRPARTANPARGPTYRLADYLAQHGRRGRRDMPPADFWESAARLTDSGDLATLAGAAEDRGLLRYAARLRKHAAAHGNVAEAAALVRTWRSRHHTADPKPAQWAAVHANLDDTIGVAWLLKAMREAGADQQAADLATRAAAHVALDNPFGVAELLVAIVQAGAKQEAADLATRAAAHAPLDNPRSIVSCCPPCGIRARNSRPLTWPPRGRARPLDNPDDVPTCCPPCGL